MSRAPETLTRSPASSGAPAPQDRRGRPMASPQPHPHLRDAEPEPQPCRRAHRARKRRTCPHQGRGDRSTHPPTSTRSWARSRPAGRASSCCPTETTERCWKVGSIGLPHRYHPRILGILATAPQSSMPAPGARTVSAASRRACLARRRRRPSSFSRRRLVATSSAPDTASPAFLSAARSCSASVARYAIRSKPRASRRRSRNGAAPRSGTGQTYSIQEAVGEGGRRGGRVGHDRNEDPVRSPLPKTAPAFTGCSIGGAHRTRTPSPRRRHPDSLR